MEMMAQQRHTMVPSAARTRIGSKPPSRGQEFVTMQKHPMQSRIGGLENIPKNMRRPPPIMMTNQKPQMIDLRDEPDHQKLGKRYIQTEDVENIEEESPTVYHRNQKSIKK